MLNQEQLQIHVSALYAVVGELEKMFPGRHFTPDGHMVGSLGECLVADAYELELMPASNEGYDAVARDGRQVEIKATQGRSVAFRCCPQHTIIISLARDGTFTEEYNGPGHVIWDCFKAQARPSNGQYQISLNRVRELNKAVGPDQRIERRN